MDDKIKSAFDSVRADEDIKNKTRAFISKKTHGYTKSRKTFNYKLVLPAAALCLALFLFTGIKLYFTATVRINIDINPSLELGINRFNKVVSVKPLNKDGEELAKTLDIKFENYDKALREILDNKSVEALLSDNDIMTVTVVETNTAQSSGILSEVRSCVREYENVYCHSASSEEVSAAHELGLPCGKYRAFLELKELDPDITPEEIRNMTMRQIRELIADLSGNGDNENSSSFGGSGHHGNGHGHGHGQNE